MQTSLNGINKRAQLSSTHRFGGLYKLLNIENLRWSFYKLNKRSCAGVDNCDWRSYQENLDINLSKLVSKLKGKSYRTKLIKRQYIPKDNGKVRALGIPTIEDKVLQHAVSKILEAIYETEFIDTSYGYRPGRSAHHAVEKISCMATRQPHNWVVEADIQGFFDNIDHDWLMRMLELRIDDKAMLGLIKKWLKAGVLENGKVLKSQSGTPQGGVISPVLANIYLHYVLDIWFSRVVTKHCQGSIGIVRYADDFVCFFQKKSDAEAFYRVLPKRLNKFNLDVAEEKTKCFQFTKFNPRKSDSFDFLGFEFRWIFSPRGWPQLQRRTARKKLRKCINEFTLWIKNCRNLQRMNELLKTAAAKIQGHYNYYGIKGNYESINTFYYYSGRALFKWLNRRSQKQSFNWEGFKDIMIHFRIPKPRVKRVF